MFSINSECNIWIQSIAVLLSILVFQELCVTLLIPLQSSYDPQSNPASAAVQKLTGKRTSEYSGVYSHGAVTADTGVCSSMGADILKMGGNSVDSTITTLLCTGVTNIHSTGIGGGGFMMVYDKKRGINKVFNCRETAPASAHRDMFRENMTSVGGHNIAVPGLLKCLSVAHDKYGVLPWSDLVDPVIELVRNGVVMTHTTTGRIYSRTERVRGLRSVIMNPDGRPKSLGDRVFNNELALTLQKIRNDKNAMYRKDFAKDMVEEINEHGGNFTVKDITNFQLEETDTLTFEFGKYIGHIAPPPAVGLLMPMILNIMQRLKSHGKLPMEQTDEFYHQMIESFKFTYPKRDHLCDPVNQPDNNLAELISNMTSYEYAASYADRIKDKVLKFEEYGPQFETPSDHGTSHINVIDNDGMVCSTTSSINYILGSKVIGTKTGIIYNNMMFDFSKPGSKSKRMPPAQHNFIEPGKRPLSSMNPMIITDKRGNVVLSIGASGGTRIVTNTAMVIVRTLLQNINLNDAILLPRLHHQLIPNTLFVEDRVDLNVVKKLVERGQIIGNGESYVVVQAIKVTTDGIEAVSDARKGGRPDGY